MKFKAFGQDDSHFELNTASSGLFKRSSREDPQRFLSPSHRDKKTHSNVFSTNAWHLISTSAERNISEDTRKCVALTKDAGKSVPCFLLSKGSVSQWSTSWICWLRMCSASSSSNTSAISVASTFINISVEDSFTAITEQAKLWDCTTVCAWKFKGLQQNSMQRDQKCKKCPPSLPCKERQPTVLRAEHDEGKLLHATIWHSEWTFAETDLFLLEHWDTMSVH